MNAALLDPIMSEEKPQLMSVKVPMDVLSTARIVAAYKGVTITDILAAILRPALKEMEQAEIVHRNRVLGDLAAKKQEQQSTTKETVKKAREARSGKK